MKKMIVFVSVFVLVMILAIVVVLFRQTPEPQEEESTTQETEVISNPLEDEIQDVNPTANTNPFGDSYINPFE